MSESDARLEAEFALCFTQDMPRVLRYAQRHVGLDLAEDVTAETFQIAWRKWDKLPDERLPWLIGTARKVISNQIRSIVRRRRLSESLMRLEQVTTESAVDTTARMDALRRLSELSTTDREALLLVAWDGLTPNEAAAVLGIGASAFRKRISRARAAVAASEQALHDPIGTEKKR